MSLNRCDLLIIGKYFNCITDFTNLIKVCHKFEHLLEMYGLDDHSICKKIKDIVLKYG